MSTTTTSLRALFFIGLCVVLIGLIHPTPASAHEVYVLSQATVDRDIALVSPNPFEAYNGHELEFFFWGFVSVVVTLTIFFASVFHILERQLDPLLFRLKRYAHLVARVTMGLCFIAFGYYSSFYGPEIPLVPIFGSSTQIMRVLFEIMGVAFILGWYVRYISIIALLCVAYAFSVRGWYVLSYVNYLGDFALMLILGSGQWSLDASRKVRGFELTIKNALRRYDHLAFPILRITLGFAVMIAALYAKFFHSQLAIDVVVQFHLTDYFQFDPLFVVLGALIIEFLAGLFLIIGFEIRWTLLFLAFWLTLSLLYFTESVWPHVVLFGLAISLFCHGYDSYSLEALLLRRRHHEPVL